MTAPAGVVEEVADGVYAYIQGDGGWCLNNAGLVRGPELSVMVDTAATRRRTAAWLTTVDELAPDAPRLVVCTHSHGDHTLGNCMLPADVPIVGHPRARDEMASNGLSLTRLWPDVEWGDMEVRLPNVCVSNDLTFHNGAKTIEVRHVGVSHTTNDLVAWLPADRVLFAGDQVLSGCTPFLLFGSVLGARAAVAELQRLKPQTVVPGHGPVGGPELIDATMAYLDWVIAVAKEGLRTGATPMSLVATAAPGPFPAWIDSERHVANFHRAYADLQGSPPGAPLDVEEVFGEVVRCCAQGYPVCRA